MGVRISKHQKKRPLPKSDSFHSLAGSEDTTSEESESERRNSKEDYFTFSPNWVSTGMKQSSMILFFPSLFIFFLLLLTRLIGFILDHFSSFRNLEVISLLNINRYE